MRDNSIEMHCDKIERACLDSRNTCLEKIADEVHGFDRCEGIFVCVKTLMQQGSVRLDEIALGIVNLNLATVQIEVIGV